MYKFQNSKTHLLNIKLIVLNNYKISLFYFIFLGNSDGMYHMKILIPCITAGAIIGKGGETIAQLQTETNTKIKMSKTNDFYPGKLI
jgi:hypothetical protein